MAYQTEGNRQTNIHADQLVSENVDVEIAELPPLMKHRHYGNSRRYSRLKYTHTHCDGFIGYLSQNPQSDNSSCRRNGFAYPQRRPATDSF